MNHSQQKQASGNFYKRRKLRSASANKSTPPVLNMESREIRIPGSYIVYFRRNIHVKTPVLGSSTTNKPSLLGKHYHRKQSAFQGCATKFNRHFPSCKDYENQESSNAKWLCQQCRKKTPHRATYFNLSSSCKMTNDLLYDVVDEYIPNHINSNDLSSLCSSSSIFPRKRRRSVKSTVEGTGVSNRCLRKIGLRREPAFFNVYERRKGSEADTRRSCFNGFIVYRRRKGDDVDFLNGSCSSSKTEVMKPDCGSCESSTLVNCDTCTCLLKRYYCRRKRPFQACQVYLP